jgi:hypothetical protein
MRKALTAGWLVGVLFVVLPACGGGDDGKSGDVARNTSTTEPGDTTTKTTTSSGSSDPSDIDVCGLLSEEEASSLIGVAVVAEEKNDAVGSYGVCEWAPAGQGFYTVRLTVGPADLYETLKSRVATELSGLGDKAWSYAHGSASSPQIDMGVLSGDYHVLVFGELDLAKGQQFAKAVLDALPA